MSRSFSPQELACFRVAQHVLTTHPRLSPEQRTWGANFLTSFLSWSETHPAAPGRLILPQLVQDLVYLNQGGVGMWALLYNQEVDQAIQKQDQQRLRELFLAPPEVFRELYDNPHLLPMDKVHLQRQLARQLAALDLAAIEGDTDLEGALSTALERVCLADPQNQDPVQSCMARQPSPSMIYTVDRAPGKVSPQVFCFPLQQLVQAVLENQNPATGAPFTEAARDSLQTRFRRELALVQRYRELRGPMPMNSGH